MCMSTSLILTSKKCFFLYNGNLYTTSFNTKVTYILTYRRPVSPIQ